MNALEADGLNTFYGKSHILHDVSLTVRGGAHHHAAWAQRRGQDHHAAQPGRADAGAVGPDRIFGKETTRFPPFRIAAMGVGYVPEGRKIFPNLTVEDNLRVPLERPGAVGYRSGCSAPFRGWRSAGPTRGGSFPAESRRCCRSRGRCC